MTHPLRLLAAGTALIALSACCSDHANYFVRGDDVAFEVLTGPTDYQNAATPLTTLFDGSGGTFEPGESLWDVDIDPQAAWVMTDAGRVYEHLSGVDAQLPDAQWEWASWVVGDGDGVWVVGSLVYETAEFDTYSTSVQIAYWDGVAWSETTQWDAQDELNVRGVTRAGDELVVLIAVSPWGDADYVEARCTGATCTVEASEHTSSQNRLDVDVAGSDDGHLWVLTERNADSVVTQVGGCETEGLIGNLIGLTHGADGVSAWGFNDEGFTRWRVGSDCSVDMQVLEELPGALPTVRLQRGGSYGSFFQIDGSRDLGRREQVDHSYTSCPG